MARLGHLAPMLVPMHRARRSPTCLATAAAVCLLAAVAVMGVVFAVVGQPQLRLGFWDWAALVITGTAVSFRMRDSRARHPAAWLYSFILVAMGWWWIERGLSPGLFFLWGASCDLAGFALLAALAGWIAPRILRRFSVLHLSPSSPRHWRSWFDSAQLTLITATAVLAAWISLDFRFDGLGQGIALFGLMGRTTGCMAALMLLGASIVMAWQSRSGWRGVWQYVALTTGLVFSASVGWARLDAMNYLANQAEAWADRSYSLMISAGMMTLMSGVGLSRVVPSGSDWMLRGRRAMPFFAALALIMGIITWIVR